MHFFFYYGPHRYVLASTTDIPASRLPPTEDAFKQHVMRAMYQTAVWCHSHQPKPVLWNPVGKGWKLTEQGGLEPVKFEKAAAPQEVRDLTHLYCKDRQCSQRKCPCFAAGLPCIDFCACGIECSNRGDNDAME